MSTSSPADLAVAFRSLDRRLREAPTDDTPAAAIPTAAQAVSAAIAKAAGVLGADPTADAVAAAISARRTHQWTDDDLEALQAHANDAARAIRTLQDASR